MVDKPIKEMTLIELQMEILLLNQLYTVGKQCYHDPTADFGDINWCNDIHDQLTAARQEEWNRAKLLNNRNEIQETTKGPQPL